MCNLQTSRFVYVNAPSSHATHRRTASTEVRYVDAQDVITNETACACDAPRSHSIGRPPLVLAARPPLPRLQVQAASTDRTVHRRLLLRGSEHGDRADGTHHRSPGMDEYDEARTNYLRQGDLHMLRIPNEQLIRDSEIVVEMITAAIDQCLRSRENLPPHPPVGTFSPS
ncbi:MAG TPA: DUF559 domain-containing protein [Thermoanaerobaculia bacterium]|nr:DUF559 domain-containing protein [Thermoanaerobaculia bacterium]